MVERWLTCAVAAAPVSTQVLPGLAVKGIAPASVANRVFGRVHELVPEVEAAPNRDAVRLAVGVDIGPTVGKPQANAAEERVGVVEVTKPATSPLSVRSKCW